MASLRLTTQPLLPIVEREGIHKNGYGTPDYEIDAFAGLKNAMSASVLAAAERDSAVGSERFFWHDLWLLR
jgi:hypothetical protein